MRGKIDILRHEAGHMVVAKLMGFETGELVFHSKGAGSALDIVPNMSDINSVIKFIQMRVPVLYAGAMAESLTVHSETVQIDNAKVLEFIENEVAINDAAKAREILRILAALTAIDKDFERELKEQSHRLWCVAGSIVEDYASTIVDLSKEWRLRLGGSAELSLSREEIDLIPCFASLVSGAESNREWKTE